jgi:hypothetical protein
MHAARAAERQQHRRRADADADILGPSSMGSQNCGHDLTRVCAVTTGGSTYRDSNKVSCLTTTANGDDANDAYDDDACAPDNLHRCDRSAQYNDSARCFGVAVQNDPSRNRTATGTAAGAIAGAVVVAKPGLSCCHGACGDFPLKWASCHVDALKMKFVELCVCGWSERIVAELKQQKQQDIAAGVATVATPDYGKCPAQETVELWTSTFAHAATPSSSSGGGGGGGGGKNSNTSNNSNDNTAPVVGITKCRWQDGLLRRGPAADTDTNKSAGKTSDDDGLANYGDVDGTGYKCQATEDTCRDWAECQATNLCYPEETAAIVNSGYTTVHFMVLAGSLVIFVGTLPICLSGVARALGVAEISQTCGAIGCCSSILLAGCGGTIMMFVPFIVGAFLGVTCMDMKLSAARFKEGCAADGLDACGEVLALDVMHLCAIGEGMFRASMCQIVAQVFSIVAVVVSMLGWWGERRRKKRRKQGEELVEGAEVVWGEAVEVSERLAAPGIL